MFNFGQTLGYIFYDVTFINKRYYNIFPVNKVVSVHLTSCGHKHKHVYENIQVLSNVRRNVSVIVINSVYHLLKTKWFSNVNTM